VRPIGRHRTDLQYRYPPEPPEPRQGRFRWTTRWRLTAVTLVVLAASALAVEAVREPRPPAPPPSRCPGLVAAMPPRDRLAQRLMVGVDSGRPEEAVSVVSGGHVGGVFLGGNATALLRGDALARMQAAAGPVPVAVDDEGGRVQRIDALVGSMPSARSMAATRDPVQVRALAAERGRQLRARGITVDLAPVADVSSQPADSVIGDRSFSADPDRVAEYAAAFAAGLRDAGVLPVFKHFPGHGRAIGDSHRGRVTTPPLAALRAVDLPPYRTLLDSGAGPAAVMLGHLDVPGLTGGQPATLSPAGYRLLREDFGFTGLVLTDDLGAMRAISNRYDLPDAVVAALRAGADMALWTDDPSPARIGQVLDRLLAAETAGQLPGSDEAVARVLKAKGVC
jgi:beta-N-acetylhexosaminidase